MFKVFHRLIKSNYVQLLDSRNRTILIARGLSPFHGTSISHNYRRQAVISRYFSHSSDNNLPYKSTYDPFDLSKALVNYGKCLIKKDELIKAKESLVQAVEIENELSPYISDELYETIEHPTLISLDIMNYADKRRSRKLRKEKQAANSDTGNSTNKTKTPQAHYSTNLHVHFTTSTDGMHFLSKPHSPDFTTTPLHHLLQAVKVKDIKAVAKIAKTNPTVIAEQTLLDNSALHEAASTGDVEMIDMLRKEFKEHFYVNLRCHALYRPTPLHFSVERGHYDATKLLLHIGADPNIADENSRTALDYALRKQYTYLALLLSKYGTITHSFHALTNGKINNHERLEELLYLSDFYRLAGRSSYANDLIKNYNTRTNLIMPFPRPRNIFSRSTVYLSYCKLAHKSIQLNSSSFDQMKQRLIFHFWNTRLHGALMVLRGNKTHYGALLSKIAKFQMEINKFTSAKVKFIEFLKVTNEKTHSLKTILDVKLNLIRTCLNLKEYDEAYFYLNSSEKEILSLYSNFNLEIAEFYHCFALCLIGKKNPDSSEEYFKKAIEIYSSSHNNFPFKPTNDPILLSKALTNYAKCLIEKDEFTKAKEISLQAYEIENELYPQISDELRSVLDHPKLASLDMKEYDVNLVSRRLNYETDTSDSQKSKTPRAHYSTKAYVNFTPYKHDKPILFKPLLSRFSSRSLPELIIAVKNKDSKAIAKIAESNPAVIAEQTFNDNSALHEAAKAGDVEMIEALRKEFNEHFNVNHQCHCLYRRTPLHYSVEGGHFDATELLLRIGADPNIQDEKSRTALDYALEQDNHSLALVIHKHDGVANTMKAKAVELGSRLGGVNFAERYVVSTGSHENNVDDKFVDFLNDLKSSKTPKNN